MNIIQYKGDIQPDGTVAPFRVAALDGVHPDAIQMLAEAKIDMVDAQEAQGILMRSATKFLQREHFEKYRALMYIARVGVGMDNIDTYLAARYGIGTINTPGASTKAVAQRALALMLTWSARVVQGTKALTDGRWPKGYACVEPIDLSEKTLGIIGFGRIGQEVKKFAEPHFAHVLFTDVRELQGKTALETLLSKSDVITIHMSGTSEILTPQNFALLKPGSLIVNTARGGVLNMNALLKRMDDGIHVALDVFPEEGPHMFENETIKKVICHPNFIGTPHTAASDSVTQKNLGNEAAQRMIEFAHNGIINPFDTPGHTLPSVTPTEPDHPCIRAVLTHQSVPGAVATISEVVRNFGTNIVRSYNAESSHSNNLALAVTVLDLDIEQPDTALLLIQEIQRKMQILQKRLLQYS